MQNGSLEWHRKRRAAKITSHFIRNQIEDYKSSQKWNYSTRLDISSGFFSSFNDHFGFFFVSILCCPATQQRSQFLCTAGLSLSCLAVPWAPPSPWMAYSRQRRLSTRAITSKRKTPELDRASHSLRDWCARASGNGRHGQNWRGCFGLAKQERGKLGMKDPHALYHNRNQSKKKKSQTSSWLQKYLFVFL